VSQDDTKIGLSADDEKARRRDHCLQLI